uniref:Uncharacterized protein n=1 Tax=Ralstonia solanacearum TaxID=305 RepID=A0A0S4V7P4_RALSL|nr:protein of unknown function [Ralstonia solanacearum]
MSDYVAHFIKGAGKLARIPRHAARTAG